MQTLNTLSTSEEKLAALCKKYAELVSPGAGGGCGSSRRDIPGSHWSFVGSLQCWISAQERVGVAGCSPVATVKRGQKEFWQIWAQEELRSVFTPQCHV